MGLRIEGIPDPSNLTAYSVSEDITGLDPASPDGGYGQVQFTTLDWPLSKMLSRTDITVIDDTHGRIAGNVRDVSPDGVTVSVTADSELGKFNAERLAEPYSGQMSGYIQYLMDLAGLYAPLEFQAAERVIHVAGFLGNVWEHVKMFMAAYQLELVLVGDSVVVRRPRHAVVSLNNATEVSTNINRQTSALAVDVLYHNHRPIVKGEVFPVRGEDPTIYSVDAGETIEFDIDMHASLSHVYQPVPGENVGPGDRSGTEGIYTVVGQDNLPIKPAQWTDMGGRLDVFLGKEPGVLHCVLTGAHIPHLAPFRLAESAGGTDYNSLHITGDGVAWSTKSVRIFTGADPTTTGGEVGAEVDNPYISTAAQAMTTGARTAAAHSGVNVGMSGGLPRVEEFPQSFGNLVGARVRHEDAYYRVETTNYGPGGVTFGGTLDTTVADFNNLWRGKTQSAFNDAWEDYDAGRFSLTPLSVPNG